MSCRQLPTIRCMGGDFRPLEVTHGLIAYFLLMMVNVSHLKRQQPSSWGSPVMFLELHFCPLPWLSLCPTLGFERSYLKHPQSGHSFVQPGPCCFLAKSLASDMAVPVTWSGVGWHVVRAGQWLLSLGSSDLILLVGCDPGDSLTLGSRHWGQGRGRRLQKFSSLT